MMVRKHFVTSELAANFIEIFHALPDLPAPCYIIVDDFNSQPNSTADSVAPFVTNVNEHKPISLWRNDQIKNL